MKKSRQRSGGRTRQQSKPPFNISYEIVPGKHFPATSGITNASIKDRAKAQRRAQALFEAEVFRRVGISESAVRSGTAAGGWHGEVNASAQANIDGEVSREIVILAATVLGLVWRQDAVLVARPRYEGEHAAILVSKADGSRFSRSAIEKAYRTLYNKDDDKLAASGFSEVEGAMLFINGRDLTDDQFRLTITKLVEQHLPGNVRLKHLRAEMELVFADWSDGNGEDYRRRIREAGRSDLLDWVDHIARPQAEHFLETFPWKASKGRKPLQNRPRRKPGTSQKGP